MRSFRRDTTHDAAIEPSADQFTASMPSATAPKPAIAPTIEWVVETGHPRREATSSQDAAEVSAASIPYRTRSGDVAAAFGSRIPLRIVWVTLAPKR